MSMTNPFADPDLISLSDLIELIDARRDIDHLKRRDMGSAIRTLGKWFGLPLEMIQHRPPSSVISCKRCTRFCKMFPNVGSRTSAPSYLVRCAPKPMHQYGALWRTHVDRVAGALDLLDESTYARTELSRFFRFCSNKDIAPAQICDNISAEFLAALEAETLVKAPRTRHQSTCRFGTRWGAASRCWLAAGPAERPPI